MANPWDKPVEAKKSGGNPWDKPEEVATEMPKGSSAGEAAFEGLGKGLTLGYLPQLQAATEPVTNAILSAITGKEVDSGTYTQRRDENIRRQDKQFEEHPIAAGSGMLAGGLLSTALVPAGGAAETVGGRVLQATRSGIVTGALSNPGDKEGQIAPLQLKDRIENAATSGGLSALISGSGELVNKAAPVIKGAANKLAARALGKGTQALAQKIGDKGLQEIGEAALDQGIINGVPSTSRQINARVQDVRTKIGKEIGDVIDQLDGVAVSKKAIVQKVTDQVLDPNSFPDEAFANRVKSGLENFVSRGGAEDSIPAQGIQKIKTDLGKAMDSGGSWKRLKMGQPTPDDLFKVSLYDSMQEAIINAAGDAGNTKLPELNKTFNQVSNMSKITKAEVARSNTNNLLMQLSPLLLGGASYARGDDPATATAVGLSALAAKRFGPQVAAKGFQNLSKVMSLAPNPVTLGRSVGVLNQDSPIVRRLRGNQ